MATTVPQAINVIDRHIAASEPESATFGDALSMRWIAKELREMLAAAESAAESIEESLENARN